MKSHILSLCSIAMLAAFPLSDALAGDSVLATLKTNPEVSEFTKALEDTGVATELQGDNDVMVFAPINSQFSKTVSSTAKCVANEGCKATLASLLKNHIVGKVISLNDAVQYKAGIFAVNNHFLPLTYVGAGRYTVEGQNIIERNRVDNGIIYTTDGVLAGSYERSLITAYMQASEPEIQQTSSTEKTTIPDPACGAEGCPDTKITVTTIKKTISEVDH
jgi:uncharacterized surface protein with fasciclin (FAS1) repeats